jgi:alpha-L-rhamnosidase
MRIPSRGGVHMLDFWRDTMTISTSPNSLTRRRLLQALGVGGVSLSQPFLLAGCLGGGGGDASGSTTTAGASVWPSTPTTRSYLASAGLVSSTTVTRSSGSVSAASALLSGGNCTLTSTSGGSAAVVVLDYGRVVGGIPQWEVVSFTGSPVLTLAFSESLAYVDGGDTTLGFSIACEPLRAVEYPITATGVLRGRLLQGGQRYQTLSVSGTGSVTLRAVALDAVLVNAIDNVSDTGWFQCSHDVLNRIWEAGAYTVDLNRVAAGGQPSPWILGSTGATIGPCNPALYQGGASWMVYDMAFDATVTTGGVSWLVRGSALTRLSFTLSASDDATRPNTLWVRWGSIFVGGVVPIATIPLAQPITPGTSYHVLTQVGADTIDVSIDGVPVASVAISGLPFLPPGSIGFWNEATHTALLGTVVVTDGGGQTLYQTGLTSAEQTQVYLDFPVGPNPLTVLTDGAKRERELFSLDMMVAGPALCYTSGDTQVLANGLTLMSRYRTSAGQWAGSLVPSVHENPVFADTSPQMRWYSLSYSLYNIIALADYVRYSGDTALLGSLWVAVQAELSYLQAQTNSDGLIVTDSSNGLDWHPQFGGMATGVVAQYNVAWVRALADAAMLAGLHGASNLNATLAAQSQTVRAALQATLFNTTTGVFDYSDSIRGTVTQDANSLAVSWGIAASDRVSGILNTLASELTNTYGHRAFSSNTGWTGVVSPLASGFEVEALFDAGRATEALALIESGWSMMVGDGEHACGTTWESMTLSGAPSGPDISLAHAWSAGPTTSLSRHVLGVRPTAPGFTRWLAKPQSGTLTWAAGAVPTPHGPIALRWASNPSSSRTWTVELTVPSGTVATLALPLSAGLGNVTLNGQAISTSASSTDDTGLDASAWRYLENLPAGNHVVSVAQA